MESLADRLIALHGLYQRQLLTDAEFTDLKAREIARTDPPPVAVPASPGVGTGGGRPKKLNPVVPGVGLALGASMGGLG